MLVITMRVWSVADFQPPRHDLAAQSRTGQHDVGCARLTDERS